MTRTYANKAVRADDARLKLTDEQIRALKAFRAIQRLCDEHTAQTLGEEMGCSKWHVLKIWQGKKRKDVQAPEVSLQTLLASYGCVTVPKDARSKSCDQANARKAIAGTTKSTLPELTKCWTGLTSDSAARMSIPSDSRRR